MGNLASPPWSSDAVTVEDGTPPPFLVTLVSPCSAPSLPLLGPSIDGHLTSGHGVVTLT